MAKCKECGKTATIHSDRKGKLCNDCYKKSKQKGYEVRKIEIYPGQEGNMMGETIVIIGDEGVVILDTEEDNVRIEK